MPETPALDPALLKFISETDPATVPPAVTTTGPDDPAPAPQDPEFEEADIDDADADQTLADPAALED